MNHRGKICLGILLCAIMIAGLLPGTLTAASAENYSLWIGGVQVTSDNLAGSGWSFTPKTDSAPNTLVLDGFSYSGAGYSYNVTDGAYLAALFYNSSDPLVITLTGSNVITATGNNSRLRGIFSFGGGAVTIGGSGSLNVSTADSGAYNNAGIDVGSLTITGGTVTVTGGATSDRSTGISASTVTISGGTVTATGGNSSSSGQSYGIGATTVTVNGGTVIATGGTTSGQSYGIQAETGTVTIGKNGWINASGLTKAINGRVQNTVAGSGWPVLNSTNAGTGIAINTTGQTYDYQQIRFPEVAYYPLYVGGTRVTSDNLSGTGWSFTPKTDSAPNTLTLNGFSYSGEGAAWNTNDGSYQAAILYTSQSDPLVITLTGSSEISATGGDSRLRGIMSVTGVTIGGSGSLSVQTADSESFNSAGIDVASLTITGGTLTAAGGATTSGESNGISAGTVTITGGTLTATGGETTSGESNGISAGTVTVNGGTVTAAGGSFGITGSGTVTIGTGGRLTASGSTKAVNGTVTNAIVGGGYSNVQGTQGATIILVSTDAQTFDYKYVSFPAEISCKLYVGNTEVTSTCLSGDGWSYNPKNQTLTLNDATIPAETRDLRVYEGPESGKANIYSWNDLTVDLQGTNTLSGTKDIGIYVFGDLTIQGTGNLTVQSATDSAIRTGGSGEAQHGGNLSITGGTIQASGSQYGLYAWKNVTVNGGNVSMSSAGDAIHSYVGSIVFNGGTVTADTQSGHAVWAMRTNHGNQTITIGENVMITKPKNGSVGSISDYPNYFYGIVDAKGVEAGSVKIEPPPSYSITVSDQVSGGTIDVPNSAKVGDTVQLKVTDSSALAIKWEVTESDGTPVTISDTNTFIMPADDVTVFAWFSNPTVTIEFGEKHADFAAFYRQQTGWGGTGSQVTFSIEAGQTVGDARNSIYYKEHPVAGEWITDTMRHDQGEILDINMPYSLKALTSYTDYFELSNEFSQVPRGSFTLYAPWLKPAGNVRITVIPLDVGTNVGTQDSGSIATYRTDPTVTATVTGNAIQSTASGSNWYKDEDYNEWLSGTVEEGQALYAQVRLEAKLGYYFADVDNSVTVTRGTIQKTDFNTSAPEYLTIYIVLPPVTTHTVTPPSFPVSAYIVTFKSGEETLSAKYVTSGAKVAPPDDPAAPEGYRFEGWFAEGAGMAFDFDMPITANLTLYARFAALSAYESLTDEEKDQAGALIAANGDKEPLDKDTAAQMIKLAMEIGVPFETLLLTDAVLNNLPGDGDPTGTSFSPLLARVTKRAKTSLKIGWNKMVQADGYLVYGNKCGSKYNLKLLITADKDTLSYTQKKLKKGKSYKFMVVACKTVNDKKMPIAASVMAFGMTKGGKKTVVKSVKVAPSTVELVVGQTVKLKASEVKAEKGKKIKRHRPVKYESDNLSIATVDASGTVIAVGEGSTIIYVYAQNGLYKTVTVTVTPGQVVPNSVEEPETEADALEIDSLTEPDVVGEEIVLDDVIVEDMNDSQEIEAEIILEGDTMFID